MSAPVRDTASALLEEELSEVLQGLGTFLEREVVPRHQESAFDLNDPWQVFDPDGRYCPRVLALLRQVREAAAAAGYYTMLVPRELGGEGLGYMALYRVWELIYEVCGPHFWLGYSSVAHWARGPSPVLAESSGAVRTSVLPELMSGTATLCFCMSEPDAGSDVWMMRTNAEPAGHSWLLNGTKQWITNGPYADYAVVFAVTDAELVKSRRGGISAFLVPTTTPGFQVDSVLRLFGHSGGDEAIISFRDVKVGPEALIGTLGEGLHLALSGASMGRLYNSARSVGLARWALERAVTYAGDRVTFGKPINQNQGISFPLAENATELWAARTMGLECARRLDAGLPARTELSMTKMFSTEMAVRVIDRAMQVHGAMGFTNEAGLAEAWQQARRICVADGSSEVMRRQVARAVLGGEVVR